MTSFKISILLLNTFEVKCEPAKVILKGEGVVPANEWTCVTQMRQE